MLNLMLLATVALLTNVTGSAEIFSTLVDQNTVGSELKKPDTADKTDKMLCKSSVQTGSRFPERICKKRSQWAIEQRETQDALRGANRQSGTCGQRC